MNSLILLFSFLSFCSCAPEEELIKSEVAPVLGGRIALPLDSPKVINILKLLQNFHNKKSFSLYWSKITSVEEAWMQVTNGIDYLFTFIIVPTGCLKEEDLETCKTPSFEDEPVEKCHYFLKQKPQKTTVTIFGKTCEQM
ncbi:cystatin-M [Anomaloglossus baeobatrachus]|uniref:cystatin-M n=1 Tax=Anomaloglossus baeobatrachus TaxID=238106 RepID=UPI003F4F9998